MKLRIADRILVAVAGLLLLILCAGMVAQLFFQVDVIALVSKAFTNESAEIRAGLIGLAAVLLILGVYCVFVLFRHRKRKDKFILQKNDSGELAISIKALENMVQKCLDQHDEIKVQHLYLENKKDGLLIRIRGSLAGGISIPLTVEALQKQIKQYVTACSGVEVKGIRVQIESSGKDAENAPFAIEAPTPTPLLKESEYKPASVPSAEDKEESGSVAETVNGKPVSDDVPVTPESEEDDDRPLHQRLFSTKPEPCIVPEPPTPAEEESLPSGTEEPTIPPAEIPLDEDDGTSATETDGDLSSSDVSEGLSDEEREALQAEAEGKTDPDFRESLKAFDDILTGETKE